MNWKMIVGVFPLVFLLSGCTGLSSRIENDHGAMLDKTQAMFKQVGRVEKTGPQAEPIVFVDGVWIGKAAIKAETPVSLPSIFNEPAVFDRTVTNIQDFAGRITAITGYATKVTPEAVSAAQRATTQSTGMAGVAGMAGAQALPPLPGAAQGMPGVGVGLSQPIRITYTTGSLKGLLDTASSRFGIWWKLENQTIKFFYTDTKTYTIRAVPGDAAPNATLSTGTNTGSGASSSSTNSTGQATSTNSTQTQMTSNLSVWTSMQNAIKAMLTTSGQVVASPATGSITVTDTPDVLSKVTDFVDQQNSMLGKQVVFNVTVLGVSQSEKDSYGISWNLVYSDLYRNYGIKNTFAGADGSVALSTGVISPSSKWNGTSLLINALSQQAKVRLETTASVTALNNQPTPIQVAKQTTYVASASTTTTTNAGTTASVTPGTVNAGFSMTVLPSVMPDGTVILQFSTDISALRNIRQINSGGVTVEAPEVDTKNFIQRVTMKSGESLIISGFEQTDDNLQNSGVGTPRNWLLGGGRTATGNKEVLVVIVTPVIVG